jgi:hypothetical protein
MTTEEEDQPPTTYSENHGRLIAHLDGILERERRQFSGGRTPSATFDSASMLNRVMNAGDIVECEDAMDDISQLFSLRSQVNLEMVSETLRP